jgi:uncharacterized membrane protein YraQ (UPF0718 family)
VKTQEFAALKLRIKERMCSNPRTGDTQRNLNPIIISLIWALMGLKACLLYFSVTFFGAVLEKAGGARYVKGVKIKSGCCSSAFENERNAPSGFFGNLKEAFLSAWGDFRAVMLYLIFGTAVGAGIYGFVPQDFVARIAGPANPYAIPIAAAIGVPLYIRAATAIPEMAILASIFRNRLVVLIALVIWSTAVIGGCVFNALP